MSKSGWKNYNRFALIVFIALTIFCIVQLSWWIVYHINSAKETAQLEKQNYLLQSEDADIPIEVVLEIEERQRRMVIMFISESCFFILIILLGAYQIYRTLRQSEALKRQQLNFMHAVTHEFRTPITSLRLYLETLQSGNIPPDKTAELYPKMIDDTNRLESLIDNVLQAGNLSQGDYKLNLVETDLSRDVKDYLAATDPFIKRQNGSLTSDIEPGIKARTDAKAFIRVINALVDNALKYSAKGEKLIRVILRKENNNALLSVTDMGIGIDASEQKKVFERFYRVGDENTRTVNGTGLGLYLVREIIEAHDGKASVWSEGKDKGATFTITLPLA
ncbi:MAG: HAMP domain-containing histidine kinase [candidate division Zixibacteria bacterium]|nr:HAMP domain-containing histidine kinase [candidate division Zixibacteria bacterium]